MDHTEITTWVEAPHKPIKVQDRDHSYFFFANTIAAVLKKRPANRLMLSVIILMGCKHMDPPAMVLVVVPPAASSPMRDIIVGLDLIGVHNEGQILTTASPKRLTEIRAVGLKAYVLHPDANAYAALTGDMNDTERIRYIDEQLAAAHAPFAP